ncbi:MAG TPA: PDZ domain-containing protein [bacterium]|nr:PDZ domain-containing protein [bacterium]
MNLPRPIARLFAFLGPLLLVGCANYYSQYYQDKTAGKPDSLYLRLLKPTSDPELRYSQDMKQDGHALLQQGYILLGRSKFQTPLMNAVEDANAARQQAQTVGAWVVLMNNKYAGTRTVDTLQVVSTPDQTIDTSKTFVNRRGQVRTVYKSVTIPGNTQVVTVPEDVDFYEYAATFWAKSAPSPLGLLVKRPKPGDPAGLRVRVVIQGSPADSVHMKEGDLLTSLAGETLTSPEQLFDVVYRHQGQRVSLDFTRDEAEVTATFTLGQLPPPPAVPTPRP